MIKIVNTVLCLACIAGIVAILLHHNNAQAAAKEDNGATAYFGGGAWRTASTDGVSDIPANPFVARSTDGMTAGDLTPRERAAGIRRWQQLRELAEAAPAETASRPKNSRSRREQIRKAKSAKEAAHRRAQKINNRANRRSNTLFQQTRHYGDYKNTYEGRNNGRRRGGLPGNRLPRSRFR